jgi:tetratricopeptide (TPR) repeat protein
MGIANGNIGISYFLQKRYDEAIPLLEEDINMSFKAYEYDNAINSLIKLAEIRLAKNDLTNAEAEINKAVDSLYRARDPFKHKLGLLSLMAHLYEKKGNLPIAYKYADSALVVKDSMTSRLNAIALARTEQKIAAEKYNAEMEQAKTEKKLHIVIRNGLIIGILLLGIIGVLFFNRQRIKHAREQEHLAVKKNIAELELQAATKELENFTLRIHEKNEMIERVSAEIERLKLEESNKQVQEFNNVILGNLQQSTILTEEEWGQFRTMFEQVHSGYLSRLKEKYPALSPADTRFIVLNKLKFSNKEMEGVLGVGSEAIRQYRFRVRKKLSLPEEINLDEVVEMI